MTRLLARGAPRLAGGNGHALSHFTETGGLYPLCAKLGTITAAGGDVYSYAPDEDDMVRGDSKEGGWEGRLLYHLPFPPPPPPLSSNVRSRTHCWERTSRASESTS